MPINNPVAFYDQAVKYVPVVPRVLELDNVDVPTTGQIYQLSAVPSDRPVVAVCHLQAGFSASPGSLGIIAESIKSSQSVVESVIDGLNDAYHFRPAGGAYLDQSRSLVVISTSNGQVWLQRAGTYFSVAYQTKLWTLGYWEGLSL